MSTNYFIFYKCYEVHILINIMSIVSRIWRKNLENLYSPELTLFNLEQSNQLYVPVYILRKTDYVLLFLNIFRFPQNLMYFWINQNTWSPGISGTRRKLGNLHHRENQIMNPKNTCFKKKHLKFFFLKSKKLLLWKYWIRVYASTHSKRQ